MLNFSELFNCFVLFPDTRLRHVMMATIYSKYLKQTNFQRSAVINSGHLDEAAISVPPSWFRHLIVAPVEDNLKISKHKATMSRSV